MASRSRRWRLIRTIPTAFSWRSRGILMVRIRSAASIARPMAARPSRKCCTRTKTSAPATWRSIRRTPTSVYATLWEAREGPWENGEWNGTGGGIFKSTDGGKTWHPLAGGLPRASCRRTWRSRAAIPSVLFASVASKDKVELYRSENAGATWALATTDPRPQGRIGGGDLAGPDARSQESRRRLHDQHRHLEVHRRRQDAGRVFAARPAATTTRTSGSIPTTPTSSFWPAIRAPSSPSTAARAGARGTTSRRRSSTM